MSRIEARCKNASALRIAVLPILGEPATTIEPSKRAFRRSSVWQDYKIRAIGTFDDLHRQMRANDQAALLRTHALRQDHICAAKHLFVVFNSRRFPEAHPGPPAALVDELDAG